jgi:hypothetical protein
MPKERGVEQLKHNIAQDYTWRTTTTDQKRLLLGSYGGPTVAYGPHEPRIPRALQT